MLLYLKLRKELKLPDRIKGNDGSVGPFIALALPIVSSNKETSQAIWWELLTNALHLLRRAHLAFGDSYTGNTTALKKSLE